MHLPTQGRMEAAPLPRGMLACMDLETRFRPAPDWESLYRFRQALDDMLESEQGQGADLAKLLTDLQEHFTRALDGKASRLHVHAEDEEDDWIYVSGALSPEVAAGRRSQGGWAVAGDGSRVYTGLLDVQGEVFGSFAFFPGTDTGLDEEWTGRYVEGFVEQLDNHVFQVREERTHHKLSLELQGCLETPVFEEGLDASILFLFANLPIEGFVLLYQSKHTLYPEQIAYRAYGPAGKVQADSYDARDQDFEEATRELTLAQVSGHHLQGGLKLGQGAPMQLPLIRAGASKEVVGKMFFWLERGAPQARSIAHCEILQSCIIQRLADYSRETRILQRYFPQPAVRRLLRTEGYGERFLAPRVETVAVTFIDVAGFTSLSEGILVEPDRIGKFVDAWSEGATRMLLEHDGVMDKLIGDCVMALHGPPFFEKEPAVIAADAVRAALAMQRFTQQMIDHPALAEVRDQVEARGGLDVSTGIHLCQTAVGIFGSNEDYTAFGSGVNNAARLQAQAKPGQTLVMAELAEALKDRPDLTEGFTFGEEGSAAVKNVAEPIRWVEVLPA